jgi:hypothetical protein
MAVCNSEPRRGHIGVPRPPARRAVRRRSCSRREAVALRRPNVISRRSGANRLRQTDRSRTRHRPDVCRVNAIARRLVTASLLCHGCGRAMLTVPDECSGSKGMTGCVDGRFFFRGSGSIPSSGQGAGGGDGRPRGVSGLDRRLPRAYSRSGPGHPGRHRIGTRGWAGFGLSHEHQMPLFNREGDGGWPATGAVDWGLPRFLTHSATMSQTFTPGTLPATVSRPGQLGSLSKEVPDFQALLKRERRDSNPRPPA